MGATYRRQRSLVGERDAENQGLRGVPGFRCRPGTRRGVWVRSGTCSQFFSTLPDARCPECRQLLSQLPLFLIEYLGAGHGTERGNTCFQQEKGWGETPTRLPIAPHRVCSPEPCKSAPRKPVEIIFQKDRFLFLTTPSFS